MSGNGSSGLSGESPLNVSVLTCAGCSSDLRRAMNELESESPLGHPFQTEGFVELFGTDPKRPPFVVIAEDGKGLAAYWRGYVGQYRSLPWRRSVCWLKSGPVIRADRVGAMAEIVQPMVRELRAFAAGQHVGWVVHTSEAVYCAAAEVQLLAAGFRRREMETFLIDLTPDPGDLWARVDQRARWSANKARKNGVVVEHSAGEADVRAYYRLYMENASVRGDCPPSEEQFVAGFGSLSRLAQGYIMLAKYDGRAVAGSLFICQGAFAAQLQHAISPEARRLNAGSLMVWESLLRMKDLGFSTLDLVSVEVAPAPGSREEGVRSFKEKWGGELVRTPVYQYWSPAIRTWRSVTRNVRRVRSHFPSVAGPSR